jgi:hypothetical protein
MRARQILILTVFAVALVAKSALAHHSFAAEFDASKHFKFTGKVTEVKWQNPHTFFYMDVMDEKTGKVTNWGMEMGSPSILMRSGWRRDSMKVGEMVTVEGSMAKDGSNTGNAQTVILVASGKKLFAGSSQGNTP